MAPKPLKKVVKSKSKKAVKPAPKASAKKKMVVKAAKKETPKQKVDKKKAAKAKAPKKAHAPKVKATAKVAKEAKDKKKPLKAKELSAKEKQALKKEAKKNKMPAVEVDEKSAQEIKDTMVATVTALADDYPLHDIFEAIKKIDFFTSETDECWEKGCDNPVTTHGHCRLHYIKNWHDIKKKQTLLVEGKLQEMIQDLITKYPLKYIEEILGDMKDEKSFYNVLRELDIDSSEEDFEEVGEGIEDDQDIAFETRVGSFKGILSEDEE